jgi:hypothetical protein
MPKRKSPANPNGSHFLPSLLDAFGGSGFQSRKRKLADEAIELTRGVFAGPPEGMTVPAGAPELPEDAANRASLVRELITALKYINERARKSAAENRRTDAKACARAYSTCLQVCLLRWGIAWPSGVFKIDATTAGSGPTIPERAFRAAAIKAKAAMEEGKYIGAHRIAKLIAKDHPGDLPEDYSSAAKTVEGDLARTEKPFRGASRFGPNKKPAPTKRKMRSKHEQQ